MMVVDDLRIPLPVQQLGHGLGLRHVVHEPIAIVVVPDIVMVKLGRPGGLERGPKILVIQGRLHSEDHAGSAGGHC